MENENTELSILRIAQDRALRISIGVPKVATATLGLVEDILFANAEMNTAENEAAMLIAAQKRHSSFDNLKGILLNSQEYVKAELKEQHEDMERSPVGQDQKDG